MQKLKACMVCFKTDVKLFSMDRSDLRHDYNLLTGLQVPKGIGMLDYLCYECTGYVKHFIKFRDKCHRAHSVMQELLRSTEKIDKTALEAVNCGSMKIKPNLSILDAKQANIIGMPFQFNSSNVITTDIMPVAQCSDILKNEIIELHLDSKVNVKAETPETDILYETPIETTVVTVPCTTTEDMKLYDDLVHSDDDTNNDIIFNEVENNLEVKEKTEGDYDGLDTDYANLILLSLSDAKAANNVKKAFGSGQFKCDTCSKSFKVENEYNTHLRMHNKFLSGNYWCELCNYYYKTDYLLQSHIAEMHTYKYSCKSCTEISYDRQTAKLHFINNHLKKGIIRKDQVQKKLKRKKNNVIKESKVTKCTKRSKKKGRKPFKVPKDFPIHSSVTQEEQHEAIEKRKTTSNYLDSKYRCEMCYRGFLGQNTYDKHMRKHDPAIAGNLQCDVCKFYFDDLSKVYRHMMFIHMHKYTCQTCKFICFDKRKALMHYNYHKNVTYSCPHCDKVYMKESTRLTHIRKKHPSMFICDLCGYSFISKVGLACHRQKSHTKEEMESRSQVITDKSDPLYCSRCDIQFVNRAAFDTHLLKSNKHAVFTTKAGRPRKDGSVSGNNTEVHNIGAITSTNCEICGVYLPNDVQARKHYKEEHPGEKFLKRYMCDVCGHTTKKYANLTEHMRKHTREKPYQCEHCDRCFGTDGNRRRHILLVHTGEKRFECEHCNSRFGQSGTLKLHIQTVHMKIPYGPWEKKNRKRRKVEDSSTPVSNPEIAIPTSHKSDLDKGNYLSAYMTYSE